MQNVKEMYGSVTVVLAGELDHCTAPQIRRQLDEILEDPGVRHLCLDLGDLTFMDSSGIGILLNRYKQMAGSGGTVTIYGVNAQIGRVLAIGGIGRIMKYFDTKEAAIAG